MTTGYVIISIVILMICLILGATINKRKALFAVSRILMFSFFVSTFVLCWSIIFFEDKQNLIYGIQACFIALQSTLRIFAMDFDYEFFQGKLVSENIIMLNIYNVYTSVLLAVAPILTIGVILSFFNNIYSYFQIKLFRKRRVLIFSELNKESLAIATSYLEEEKKKGNRIIVIFTDVYKENEESASEMLGKAYAIGANCLKTDILSINNYIGIKHKLCEFFIIGKDEKENTNHTLGLMKMYYDQSNIRIYLFSECKIEKLIINAMIDSKMKVKVRCIHLKQNIVYNYLYKNNLFKYAIDVGRKKILSLGIMGDNTYVKEMTKAMLWYGQMPGYELQLHIFDEKGMLEEELKYECPELMERNGIVEKGESQYDIQFHVCKFKTENFDKELKNITYLSALYLMYEDEKKNIEIGIHSDRILKKNDKNNQTRFICLVSNTIKRDMLQKKFACEEHFYLKDHKGNKYNLEYIYQEWDYNYIFNNDLEEAAKEEHLKWVKNPKLNPGIKEMDEEEIRDKIESGIEDFYNYDYFYRSSVARVIRLRVRRELEILGTEKRKEERTKEERRIIREIEHRGWNAYMRTEGYCLGDERNEMLKIHPDLKPFYLLSEKEQEKDDD